MKTVCGFFSFIFGLTAFSCFYNLFAGESSNSPTSLLLCGILMVALTALCLYGLKRSIDRGRETGSSIIVKTKIIDAQGKVSAGSAAVRGAVGNAVAGPVGAIVGASTAKSNRSTTFLVIYKNGKKVTKTVPNNSFEYQKYVKYLDA